MKMNPSLYQVTEWASPEDPVDTLQFGEVSQTFWLSMELHRWAVKGDSAIIKIDNGRVALFGYGVELPVEPETNERNSR